MPCLGVLALALSLLPALPAQAVSQGPAPRPLAVSETVTDSLAPGAAHTFSIEMSGAPFIYGEVRQHSVDVRVTVRGPDGEIAARFDNRRRGLEPFQASGDAPGPYRVEVEADGDDETGTYEIRLLRAEPVATDPAARVDQLMSPFSGDVPGAVVAVVRDGELAFARGYGMADLTHHIPFTAATPTNIGSTSKQFTAFAINLLASRGALSLDDDVRMHIPELPDFGETVTLRHLLTHTSGYREFLNTLALAGRRLDEGDHVSRSEIIPIVQRQPGLQNAPGSEWNYNNTAYSLLATVVERVGGAPFPEWMRENVFKPLGMESTQVRATPSTIVEGRAMGYIPLPDGGYREASDLGGAYGAGGIYTTVGDLARWVANLETGRLGGRQVIDAMTTPYVLTDGDTTNYGLGLFIDEFRGIRRIHHGGADVAHRSMLAYYPSERTAVITLGNNAALPGSIHTEVAEAFLGDALESEPAEGGAPAAEAADFDPAGFDPASFDDFAGRYSLDPMPAFVMTFWRDGDRLLTQATGQPQIPLTPTSDSTFELVGVPASVAFHRSDDGGVTHLTLFQNGEHRATRLEGAAWAPSEEDLRAYAGRYFSEELETFYTVAVEDGELLIRHPRLDDVTLEPGQTADEFSGGFPVASAEFERDADGRVTALIVGNGRTREVRFERMD